MSLINPVGLHHLRITVTDLARSRAFYQDVLGFAVIAESPGDPSDPQVRNDPAQLYGGVVLQIAGLLFGLRPVADPADRFVSERVGLDHLSLFGGFARRTVLGGAATAPGRCRTRRGERTPRIRYRDPVFQRSGRDSPGTERRSIAVASALGHGSNIIRNVPNPAVSEIVGMEMQEMIDFELWLISMIRAICQREGVRLPSIARADELLDERLSLQRAVRLCRRRQAPARQFPDDPGQP